MYATSSGFSPSCTSYLSNSVTFSAILLLAFTRLKISVTSFGFKNGSPRDADLVLDVRFLPNPHWKEALRSSTGQSPMVSNYVLSFEDAEIFLEKTKDLINFLLPRFTSEGKSYVGIAIGCTGGKHRSVVMTEEIGSWLKKDGKDAVIIHRDMKES